MSTKQDSLLQFANSKYGRLYITEIFEFLVETNNEVLFTEICKIIDDNLKNEIVEKYYWSITKDTPTTLTSWFIDNNFHLRYDYSAPARCVAEHNNLPILKLLIESGCDVTNCPIYCISALESAIKSNNFEIAEYLLQIGMSRKNVTITINDKYEQLIRKYEIKEQVVTFDFDKIQAAEKIKIVMTDIESRNYLNNLFFEINEKSKLDIITFDISLPENIHIETVDKFVIGFNIAGKNMIVKYKDNKLEFIKQ
jgi:hypothetical protein